MSATAILMTVMLTWIFAVYGADARHLSDDSAAIGLRTVRERLGKELRGAEYLTVASDDTITYWSNIDRDETLGTGELVSWTIESDGDVVRSTDAGATITLATGVSQSQSGFSFDAGDAADVAIVSVELVALVDGADPGSDSRHLSTDIALRNK